MRLKVTVDTRRDSSQLVAESKSFRFTSPWMDDTADVDDAALRSRPRSSHWPGVPADLVEPLSEALDVALHYEDRCDRDGWINTDDLPTLDETRRIETEGFVRDAGTLTWKRHDGSLRMNHTAEARWTVKSVSTLPPFHFDTIDAVIPFLRRQQIDIADEPGSAEAMKATAAPAGEADPPETTIAKIRVRIESSPDTTPVRRLMVDYVTGTGTALSGYSPWFATLVDAAESRPRKGAWYGISDAHRDALSSAIDLASKFPDVADAYGWITLADVPTPDEVVTIEASGFKRVLGVVGWMRDDGARLNFLMFTAPRWSLRYRGNDYTEDKLEDVLKHLEAEPFGVLAAQPDLSPARTEAAALFTWAHNAIIAGKAEPEPEPVPAPSFAVRSTGGTDPAFFMDMTGADGRQVNGPRRDSESEAAADALRAAELWGDGYDKPTPIGWERPHAQAYPIPDRPARKAAVDAAKQWLATRGIAAESLRPVTGQIEAAFTRAINAVPGLTFRSVAVLEPGTSDAPAHLAVFFHHNWREPAAAVGLAVLSRACCDRYYNESFKATGADPERYAPTWTLEVDHVDVAPFTVYRLTGPADTAIAFAKAIEQVLSRDNVMSMFRADLAPPDMETVRDLRAAYVAADQPFVGFVTADGITRVPPAIMADLGNVGASVAWSIRQPGVYGMATIKALHAIEDAPAAVDNDEDADRWVYEDHAKQAAEIAELRSSLDVARRQIAALTAVQWEDHDPSGGAKPIILTVPGERVTVGSYYRDATGDWRGKAMTRQGKAILECAGFDEHVVRTVIEAATGVKP